MIFSDNYKVNKKYPKKLFLENKEIDAKSRSKIKKHVIAVELSHQIMNEEITSIDNDEYKYKVIQYLLVELDDIKNAKEIGEIFQNAFKSPLIIKINDNRGYFAYSLALKRINKINSNEIVIDDIFITDKYDDIINVDMINLFSRYLNMDNLLNKSNKLSLYYEIYLKAFIIENRKNISSYKDLLTYNFYYDLEKMKNIHKCIKEIIEINLSLIKSLTIKDKLELNNRKKDIFYTIENIV